jgi:hypothetical protein
MKSDIHNVKNVEQLTTQNYELKKNRGALVAFAMCSKANAQKRVRTG